ncbi:hypothetical protein, partial [Rhodopirellula bahusiensis]|uniref:hypothetical protein n=2 Tax=Rhodopirellula bahusiensis TaxID=2014065 RepID=UPI0032670350
EGTLIIKRLTIIATGEPRQLTSRRASKCHPLIPCEIKPNSARRELLLMSDLDGDAIIAKYCNALGDRARYDADLSSTVLSDLSCAIVMVNAFWSGPSMQTLVRIANVIAEVDSDRRIQLIVCDTDHVPDLSLEPWTLNTLGGYGEIAWVLNGEIVARRDPGREPDLTTTTCSLLASC